MASRLEMEYVEVHCEEPREVFVDGQVIGKTNEILRLSPGTHTIDLGKPKDYSPAKKKVELSGTNPEAPLVINFKLKAAATKKSKAAKVNPATKSNFEDVAALNKASDKTINAPFDETMNAAQQSVNNRPPDSETVNAMPESSIDNEKSSGQRFAEQLSLYTAPHERGQLLESSLVALMLAADRGKPLDVYTWFLCLLVTPQEGGEQLEETAYLVLDLLSKEFQYKDEEQINKTPIELPDLSEARRRAQSTVKEGAVRRFVETLRPNPELAEILSNVYVLEEVFIVMERAGLLAQQLNPEARRYPAVCHIIATLLFDSSSPPGVVNILRKQAIPIDALRADFYEAVVRRRPDEDKEIWYNLIEPEKADPWQKKAPPPQAQEPAKPQETPVTGEKPVAVELDAQDSGQANTVFAGYTADTAEDKQDLLDITRDVNAICSILAAKNVPLPLSLGLFGDWGTGKTFFMNRMYDRIKLLADKSKDLAPNQSAYSPNIVQIRFNAWHYIDANLWACLVTHILDSIYNYLNGKDDNPWNKAVEDLEQAEGLHKAAKHSLTQAQKSVKMAEQELQYATHERDKKEQDIDVQLNSLKNLLTDKMSLQFKETAKTLGLEEAIKSLDELTDQLESMKSRSGNLKAFLTLMLHSRHAVLYSCMLLLVLFVPVVFGVLVQQISSEGGMAVELGTMIGQVGTAVVGFTVWLKKPLGWLNTQLSTLEKIKQEAENARQAKLTAHENDPAQTELAVLQEKETAAREALRESKKRLQQAQIELDEAQPSRRLYRLIEERTESEDYRSRLGIISLIRNDFEKLSSLMRPDRDEIEALIRNKKPLPRPLPVDRIILYIDDLDRCPQHRVVEVLEAVHLLLAFPIFAVVVGVDPRWLRRSLELHYPHLLTSLSDDGTQLNTDDGSIIRKASRTRAATPQNYLEKIFQIPFNLRPMGKGGYEALVKKLAEAPKQQYTEKLEIEKLIHEYRSNDITGANTAAVSDSHETDNAASTQISNHSTENNSTENHSIESQTVEPHQNEDNVANLEHPGGDADVAASTASTDELKSLLDRDTQLGDGSEQPTTAAGNAAAEPQLDLIPSVLEFTENEKDYITRLYRLFSTPRAVKRFVNTYRIFRARLPDAMLDNYINDHNEAGEYRCVLVLLGIITGFPSLAPKTMKLLYQQPANAKWTQFVDNLTHSTLSEFDFPPNELPQSIAEMESDWVRMCDALQAVGEDGSLPFDMQIFVNWAPRVARFSFSNVLPPWRSAASNE